MARGVPADLTGQRFGYWQVVEPVRTGEGCRAWLCRCLCGNTAVILTHPLTSGGSTRCRACGYQLKREKWSAAKNDWTGRRFGDWQVIGYAGSSGPKGHRQRTWLCRCICGTTASIKASILRQGSTHKCRECADMDRAARMSSERLTWLPVRDGTVSGQKPVDLTGQRFGQWTVLFHCGYHKAGERLWMCLCTCGRTANVFQAQLQGGRSTKCRWCAARARRRRGIRESVRGEGDMKSVKRDGALFELIGAALRAVRRGAGLSQQDVADLMGVSASAISNYETARLHCPMDQFVVWCQVLEEKPDVVLATALGTLESRGSSRA